MMNFYLCLGQFFIFVKKENIMQVKINKWISYFHLGDEQEDFHSVYPVIEKGIIFKGTNLWILICAIVIASVGLNMNSTAVIIGAMLISPLMGPINGMGYSIATYDFSLFRRSINNFSFAVAVSLVSSTVYFIISPVSTAHSELLARTSPTIYDVFIALFGGGAGMLAINSKLKGNVVPGVAIATALMPPICTAGYGLATLQFNFFFGALYLFTINTVFIAVAGTVVARFLKFPMAEVIDEKKSKRIKFVIQAILFITVLPSIFLGYRLVKNESFLDRSKKFINEVSVSNNSYLLENKINANSRKIELIYSGYGLNSEGKNRVKEIGLRYKLDTSKLMIYSGTDASILNQQKEKMQNETDILNSKLASVAFQLNQTQSKLDSIKRISLIGSNLLSEIKQIYPQVQTCSYAETYVFPDSTKLKSVIVIGLKPNQLNNTDKSKIENWLQARLEKKQVRVFFN